MTGSALVTNAVSAAGALTGMKLMFQQNAFSQIAPMPGTTNNPFYPATATRDGFMLSSTNTAVTLRFWGLTPSQSYSFTFFGSQTNSAATNSAMMYSIGSVTQAMVTYGNNTNTVTLSGTANATGEVYVVARSFSRYPPSATVYGMLNVLEINSGASSNPPPTPGLAVSPGSFAPSVKAGQNATNQLEIRTDNGEYLSYTVSVNRAWLSASPAVGSVLGTNRSVVTVTCLGTNLTAGVYTGAVTVASGTASNSPRVVAVVLTVQPRPGLAVSPAVINAFSKPGFNAAAQSFAVRNSGSSDYMPFTVAVTDTPWLTVSSASGGSTGQASYVTANFACSYLGEGVYTGLVMISAPTATNSPQPVVVNLTVTNSFGTVATPVLSPSGGSFTSAVAVTLSCATTGATIRYTLDAGDPTLSSTLYTGAVAVATTTTIRARAFLGELQPSAVAQGTFSILGVPALSVYPASLTRSVSYGFNAAGDTFQVRNTGGGSMAYTVSGNAGWFTVMPVSGISAGETDSISVVYSTTNLESGSYTGLVTVSAAGVSGSPQPVTIRMTVQPPPTLWTSGESLAQSVPRGGSATGQVMQVRNSGSGSMAFAVTTDVAWAWANPSSGSSTGEARTIWINYLNIAGLTSGVYTGHAFLTAPLAPNSPRTVTLTLTVRPGPRLGVSPASLEQGLAVGDEVVERTISVWNGGADSMSYTVEADPAWLSVSPSAGSSAGETNAVTLAYHPAGLTSGLYTGSVRVVAAGAEESPRIIPVTLAVTGLVPRLSASVTNLAFTAYEGSAPEPVEFQLWNAVTGGVLPFAVSGSVSWLTVNPASGACTGAMETISVAPQTAALAPGVATGALEIVAVEAGNSPLVVPVRVTVISAPAIGLSPSRLAFSVAAGGATSGLVYARSAAGGVCPVRAGSGASWAHCAPSIRSLMESPMPFSISVSGVGLAAGVYTTRVELASDTATNSPQGVEVELTVRPAPVLEAAPACLANAASQGSAASNQWLVIRNGLPPDPMPFTATPSVSWLTVIPASGSDSGSAPQTLQVGYACAGLPAGVYSGALVVASARASNSPLTVPVTLTIESAAAMIAVSPALISARVTARSAGGVESGVDVWNAGGGSAMSYTVTPDVPWLSAAPATGVSTGAHNLHGILFTNMAGLAVGVHTGHLAIASGQAPDGNTPQTVTALLTIDPAPAVVAASPASQSLTLTQGEADAALTFEVWNAGGTEAMPFTLPGTAEWLTATPSSGSSAGENVAVTAIVSVAHLAPGTYDGAILVTAPSATNSPVSLGVHLTVNPQPALIAVSPAACEATIFAGGNTATQSLWVWNAGTGVMNYALSSDADWLTVAPGTGSVSGTMRRTHQVTVQGIGLGEGLYTGTVSVAGEGAANTPQGVPVVLRVLPALAASPGSLAFVVDASNNPPTQALQVWNSGSANPVDYVLGAGAAWLTLDPTNGVSAGELDSVTVGCAAAGLASGLYASYIEVTPAGFPAATRRIPVQLTVRPGGATFQERIVFAAWVNGDWNIWSCRPDGGNLEPIVVKSGTQTDPHVSPDGLKLAYRDLSASPSRVVVRALATGVETVCPYLAVFDWTPDSLALIGTPNTTVTNDLWRVGVDGVATRLFTEPDRQSPMGVDKTSGRVYYTTDPGAGNLVDLRVFDPATSNRQTILPRDGRARLSGAVSREGGSLVYQRSGGSTTGGLYVCGADGLGERLIGCAANAGDRNPDFSLDGAQVVFTRSNGLYRAPASGLPVSPTAVYTGLSDYASWCVMRVSTAAPPRIVAMPSVFYPSCTIGSNAFYQTLRIFNGGGGVLNFAVSSDTPWLVPTPSSGISIGTNNSTVIRLDFFTAGMALGTHTGRVMVTAAGVSNSPLALPVFLNVRPPPARIECSPSALSNGCVLAHNADGQTLRIRNSGGGSLSYSLATNVPWLSVSPVSGSSTGESDTITVSYNTAALPAGLATGQVTISASGAANSPQRIPVSFEVLAPPPVQPAVLGVLPASLVNSTQAGTPAPSQAITVRNTGGGTLSYRVSSGAAWLSVSPTSGVSVGEADVLGVDFNTTGLATGVYSAVVTVSTLDGSQVETVGVQLTVNPAPTYALTIVASPLLGGEVAATPAAGAGGRYAKGTPVTLTAYPQADYTFDCWLGTVISTGVCITVRMEADVSQTAVFRRRSSLGGSVTNAVTGLPVKGALVSFGTNTALTGASGVYSFREVGTMTDTLRVSRAGYQAWEEAISPAPFTNTTRGVALIPAYVSNVRAVQRAGSKLVDVLYDYETLAGDSPVVSLAFSSGLGDVWDVTPRTVSGDIGTNVAPGLNRRMVWNAGADWPGRASSAMVARVSAGGSAAYSPLFAVKTRDSGIGRVRAWTDRNRNGLCDANEALGGVEIYYDGRMATNLLGVTAADGYLTIAQPIQEGHSLFGRKRVVAMPSVKGGHASVSNLMCSIWLDSDIGGTDTSVWDGTWRSTVVSAADLAGIESGAPLLLKLGHSVFEWNLLVASEIGDPLFIAQLKQGLSAASTLLYDATDGQMKLGVVSIVAGGGAYSNALRQADLVVRGYAGMYMGFCPLGMRAASGSITAGATLWNGAPPASMPYAQNLVRAFFSYAMGLMPEDVNGQGNRCAWAQYRAQHPDEAPANYGLMDDPLAASEISSLNKYLPYYPARTNAFKVTQQIWRYDLALGRGWVPAWQHLERQFQRYYAEGIWVEIVTPQPGVYLGNNRFATDDRPGPSFIPAPYAPCSFVNATNEIRYGILSAPRALAQGRALPAAEPLPAARVAPLCVYVEREAVRVAGAEVFLRPADPGARPMALGRTDGNGALLVYDLATEDRLEVAWRGSRTVYTAAPIDRWCDSIVIRLPAAVRNTGPIVALRRSLEPAPLDQPAGDPLGLIVSGSLTASPRRLSIRILANQALAGAPVVRADLDDGSGGAVVMNDAGGNAYTGGVDLAGEMGGTLDIQAEAASGGSNSAFAAFEITGTSTSTAVRLRSRSGRVELALDPESLPVETEGVIYEGDLPPLVPAGFTPAHPVGAPVFVALADGQAWSGEAVLTVSYGDGDVAGRDERTVALFAWNEGTTNWLPVSAALSLEQNRLTAAITAPGVYALFAESAADSTPPAAIEDLVAADGTNGWTVALTWTAVGDDDKTGRASSYGIRYSTAPITNWDEATAYAIARTPAAPGETESVELRMPDPNTLYYFAVKAFDEAGNAGGMSSNAVARSQFEDADGDGVPDQAMASRGSGADLEADTDADGLTLREEVEAGTDPDLWDTDGDGMGDGWERAHGLNPLSADDRDGDDDSDGVVNRQEYAKGVDPANADSDGDGIADGWELERGLDPASLSNNDGAEADPDNDRFDNAQEYVADTDPRDAASRFVITGARPEAEGFQLDFDSSARRVYDVQRCADLALGDWETIDADRTGLGTPTTAVDTNALNPFYFYRIRVRLP